MTIRHGQTNKFNHPVSWNFASGGYQFYTTSSDVQWAIWKNAHEFCPGGSGIHVLNPEIKLNPDGSIDYDKTFIYANPVGSTVEPCSGKNKWKYVGPTPATVDLLGPLMREKVLPVKYCWQINGIPEHTYYSTSKVESLLPLPINKPVITIQYALYNSWVQPTSQVYGQNAFFPEDYNGILTDIAYDAAPARITESLRYKAPDSDWFGRACVQKVNGRNFVILYDAEGDWYCWPSDADLDDAAYQAEHEKYDSQAYKGNINKSKVIKATVKYPAWVHKGISHRDTYLADPNKSILEPRYSLSFNATGTKAIGVMVERKKSQCKFCRIDYASEGINVGFTILNNRSDNGLPYIPTEVDIEPLLLDRNKTYEESSDPQDTQVDRLGFVEFDLVITYDVEKDTFTFDVNVIDNKSPSELNELDKGSIVDIAYAAPLDWSKSTQIGHSIVDDEFTVECDDIISVWIELFQHEEQRWVTSAFDGEPSKLMPSKTIASFYKGKIFENKIFSLPLSQSHGKGYSTEGESHKFVWNPNQTLASRYPFEPKSDEYSKSLYYYCATLEQLDLSNLSFYYRVRLIEQTKTDTCYYTHPCKQTIFNEFNDGNYSNYGKRYYKFTQDMYSIKTKAKTYCSVCVMGRVVEDVFVGNPDLSNSWIKGWIKYAAKDELNDGEEKIYPTLMGNHEGIGLFPYDEDVDYFGQFIGAHVGNPITQKPSWQCNHYSYDELGSVPWWLLGACGHIVKMAITLSILAKFAPPNVYSVDVYDGQGVKLGTNTLTINLPDKNLWYYNKENIGEFAAYIFNLYNTGVKTYQWWNGTIDTVNGFGTYTKNPFTLSRVDITEFRFIEKTKEYLWFVVDHVQRTTNQSVDILHCLYPESDVGYYKPSWVEYSGKELIEAMYFNLSFISVLPEGGGYYYKKNANIYVDSNFEFLLDKKTEIKDLELGALYYNTAIKNHFYAKEIASVSKILVTPDGKISYLKKDVYDIKKEYSVMAVAYNYSVNPYYIGKPMPYRVLTGERPDIDFRIPNTEVGSSDIEWSLLDGLSWNYGLLKTKHLWTYNLAYQNEKTKKYLKHNEAFVDKYTELQYKPDFRITTNHNIKWIYPYNEENGLYKSLYQFSLPLGMEAPFISSDAMIPYHDPRPKLTELRLSPLFF